MPKRAAASRPAQNCLQQAHEHLLRALHWLDGLGTSWLADAAVRALSGQTAQRNVLHSDQQQM